MQAKRRCFTPSITSLPTTYYAASIVSSIWANCTSIWPALQLPLVLPIGPGEPVPDHFTVSKNRHGRFRDNDTLRFVFEKVLERRLAEG